MAASTVFCINCGAANLTQALFCTSCGQDLKKNSQNSSRKTGKLTAGNVLRQRYEILSQIGQGGFGAVYKAQDKDLGKRLVAVKEMSQLNANKQAVEEGVETFKREALMLAGLMHKHLPRIYEHFSENGRWYLVMDYIDGETLETYFERARDGYLPLPMALHITLQLCEVLEYLHTRKPSIIFRDLKPSNIILTAEGHLFLIDFGIARHFKPGQMKDTMAFGSPGYAAPEQYGRAQTTPRADIYSLGTILHQMITGYDPLLSPFRFAPLLRQDPALRQIVERMVDMDEAKRPASASEVKQVLEQIKKHPGTRVLPEVSAAASSSLLQLPHVPLLVHHHHYGVVRAVGWSSDSKYAASATDAIIRVWDAGNGHDICAYREHRGQIKHMSWSPLNMRIASVCSENKIRIWETYTGKTISIYPGDPYISQSLAWSHDGRYLTVAGNGAITVWDTSTNTIMARLKRRFQNFLSVSWSQDSAHIAAAFDQRVLIWHLGSHRQNNVRVFQHHSQVNTVSWSPDGAYLAYGGNDTTIHVWDVRSEQLVGVYRKHTSPVCSVCWAPDSRRIASGGFSELLNIWDALTGGNLAYYKAHADKILATAWSPDGQLILSGGSDRRVCVWRAP